MQVANEAKAVKSELKKKRSLLQMDELKCRKRVLRRLGYCTASDVIEMKGRVACEVDRWASPDTLTLNFEFALSKLTHGCLSAVAMSYW